MKVRQLAPGSGEAAIGTVLAELKGGRCLRPFAPEILEFCAAFSQALFKDSAARRFPELQALAFRMRKSELARLRQEFESLASDSVLPVPRGLVFHLPPSNVDTVFIYSWLTAVLTGNRNIVRISTRAAEQTGIICRIFRDLQTEGGAAARHTALIQYGHEREITAALSAACDVRIIWGGDAAVESIRSIPIPPHAKELTFPDRYSFAAIHAGAYGALDAAGRARLAQGFFNDTYWFDQMACSSPRLVVWCGSPAECGEAAAAFWQALDEYRKSKGYTLDTGIRLSHLTFACRAVLDQGATGYERSGNDLTLLTVNQLDTVTREHPGGGLLFQYGAPALAHAAGFVARRDQTMTHFGFPADELRAFAAQLNGRGVDRMVPVGRALDFDYRWDGYNLLQELVRHVHVQV